METKGKVIVFGAGYVGLATAAVAACGAWEVVVVDSDAERIRAHQQDIHGGRDPLGEPGMARALRRVALVVPAGHPEDRPSSVLGEDEIRDCVVVCAVGTPYDPATGTTSAEAVFAVARQAAAGRAGVFVLRSTVSPAVLPAVRQALTLAGGGSVPLVVVPEFLREGHAVTDSVYPPRLVIGADAGEARTWALGVLPGLLSAVPTTHSVMMIPEEASLVKLATNTALSLRVWLADSIAAVCEETPRASAEWVLRAVYLDDRLGAPGRPGLGAAGPCLPKDTAAFGSAVDSAGVTEAVRDAHKAIPLRIAARIERALECIGGGDLIAIYGVGFKPDSSDWRGSPVIPLIRALLRPGRRIEVHDPRASASDLDAMRAALRDLPGVELQAQMTPCPAALVLLAVPKHTLPPLAQPPLVVCDPYRLTSYLDWSGSVYLGGGLGRHGDTPS